MATADQLCRAVGGGSASHALGPSISLRAMTATPTKIVPSRPKGLEAMVSSSDARSREVDADQFNGVTRGAM
jgi:hypothetical protein